MDNETMDSSSKLTLELNPYIVDLASKSVKSCLADDPPLNLQNVNNNTPSTADHGEKTFSSHNGCTNSDHHESKELLNGNNAYDECDESTCGSPLTINSSQCNLDFSSKTEFNNLESPLSTLSIDTNTDPKSETELNQSSGCDSKKCDNKGLQSDSDKLAKTSNPEPKDNCSNQEANTSSICSETEKEDNSTSEIMYISYESEHQMPDIMKLIQKDLSEPYSIYTYRYFIHNWPHLCFLAVCKGKSVGAIVCKLDLHRKVIKRGYIAMLAVDECHRKQGIGSNLVLKAIRVMVAEGADEVVLETEITNQPALRLYENLGFVRDKRLFRYYLNGVDALRLKLWLR